VATKTADL